MNKKRCSGCKKVKPLTAFHKHRGKRGGLSSYCRGCDSIHCKRYNREKKGYYAGKTKSNRARLTEMVNQIKGQRGCIVCRDKRFYCLDFHHRNPKTKVAAISVMIRRNYNISVVRKEIRKCNVLCANCHREETWRRRHQT